MRVTRPVLRRMRVRQMRRPRRLRRVAQLQPGSVRRVARPAGARWRGVRLPRVREPVTAQAVRDAVDELTRWLPAAQALTTQPDADGTRGRGPPASRPPWNGAAAMVLLDAVEGTRRLEAAWRSGHRRPVAAIGAVLASIVRLSYGLPDCPPREHDQQNRPLPCRCQRCEAVRSFSRWTVAILQLPAVDQEERPLRVPSPCPYCLFPMLRVFPRSGRVACLRGAGACADGDGNPPTGLMGRSQMDGSPVVAWADGLVT